MVQDESENGNEASSSVTPKPALIMSREMRREFQTILDNAAKTDKGDGKTVCKAICLISKEIGIQRVAEAAGLERTSFYRTFNGQTDARISNVLRVVRALGCQLKLR